MIVLMRSAWRRISSTGEFQVGSSFSIVGERVEIAADDGQRRAQLVRGIRDEILAHRLQLLLAADVAHHQQLALGRAGAHDVEREPAIDRPGPAPPTPSVGTPVLQVLDEVRMPHQVLDADAEIALAPQPAAIRAARC